MGKSIAFIVLFVWHGPFAHDTVLYSHVLSPDMYDTADIDCWLKVHGGTDSYEQLLAVVMYT